jgi:hypothetical protein
VAKNNPLEYHIGRRNPRSTYFVLGDKPEPRTGTGLHVTKATRADAYEMATKLQSEQADLIAAIGNQTVSEAINRSLAGSHHAYAGRVNGELVALWGVFPLEGGAGYPWLYAEIGIAKSPRITYTMARRFIDEMLKEYPRLYGFVDSRFERSMTLAIHLGFTIGTYPANPPFLTIERTAHEIS